MRMTWILAFFVVATNLAVPARGAEPECDGPLGTRLSSSLQRALGFDSSQGHGPATGLDLGRDSGHGPCGSPLRRLAAESDLLEARGPRSAVEPLRALLTHANTTGDSRRNPSWVHREVRRLVELLLSYSVAELDLAAPELATLRVFDADQVDPAWDGELDPFRPVAPCLSMPLAEVAKQLHEAGPWLDVFLLDPATDRTWRVRGPHALSMAVRLGNPDLVRAALAAGADPNRAWHGVTPLGFALGHHELAWKPGRSPYHFEEERIVEIARMLVEAGARMDCRDPLDQAGFRECLGGLEPDTQALPGHDYTQVLTDRLGVLLDAGCDPLLALDGKDPYRAFSSPRRTGSEEAVRLLRAAGVRAP